MAKKVTPVIPKKKDVEPPQPGKFREIPVPRKDPPPTKDPQPKKGDPPGPRKS